MMSLKSLFAFAIILIISRQHSGAAEAKSLDVKNQVKFRRLPPKEFSVALGSSITIECEAGASPPPTIHWLKNGKRIYLNELDTNKLDDYDQTGSTGPVDDVNRIALSATRSRLYIDCADVSDEATYTCVADNKFSRVSSHTKLNLIRPAVQMATRASSRLASQTPDAPATMGGSENDLSLSELGASSSSSGSGSGSSNTDAGQLQRQREQSGASNIDLALTAVPQCLSDRMASLGAPIQAPARIHMWTHNIVEIMKNNVIIYCRSNVNQRPGVAASSGAGKSSSSLSSLAAQQDAGVSKSASTVWTLPDDQLVSDEMKDKYEVLETGDLLIKDLRWSDMGSYVCTVSDERGSDSVSAFVYPASVKAASKRSAAVAATNWNLNIR